MDRTPGRRIAAGFAIAGLVAMIFVPAAPASPHNDCMVLTMSGTLESLTDCLRGGEMLDPRDEPLVMCETYGERTGPDKRPFRMIDSGDGANYDVWVLQEVHGDDLRVGFNNQVVESRKATSIDVVTVYESNGANVSWQHDTEVDSTGACGVGAYNMYGTAADPSDVTVTVKFSGMDVTKSEAEGETVTHTEWSEDTETWGFSATAKSDGGEITGSYSNSHAYGKQTTTEWSSSSSVTWSSSEHTFQQDYSIP